MWRLSAGKRNVVWSVQQGPSEPRASDVNSQTGEDFIVDVGERHQWFHCSNEVQYLTGSYCFQETL